MPVESAFHDARRIVIVVCPECKWSSVEREASMRCAACGEEAVRETTEKTEQG